MIQLPTPRTEGGISVEEALGRRRSIREYALRGLTLAEVSQLLWSGYGVTSPEGFRTAPSARALYPLEIHLAAGEVAGLASGVYRYVSAEHALRLEREGDVRRQLAAATFGQDFVGQAAVVLVLTAVYERTREAFQDAGRDYAHMDLGHAGQNVHLQAVSLRLGTVVVAAFRPAEVRDVLGLPADETPLYLMPIGHPA
jgi:SagB-type dehydrogenase family enzyme